MIFTSVTRGIICLFQIFQFLSNAMGKLDTISRQPLLKTVEKENNTKGELSGFSRSSLGHDSFVSPLYYSYKKSIDGFIAREFFFFSHKRNLPLCWMPRRCLKEDGERLSSMGTKCPSVTEDSGSSKKPERLSLPWSEIFWR